ncbi:MAG: DMT family transporter [Chloroflexi bacterium]|nr:DMT family transporter [Chloroflexota bacterium]MDA1239229.1 DMT family transporter [Chloroflexota bacterium]
MTARHVIVLTIGVFAVAWAAPLIRAASEGGTPVLVIAALRLTIAAPPMMALAAWRGVDDLRALTRRDWAVLLFSGVMLAAHFALWVAAIQRTSVLSGVVLVTMQPIFVALGAWLVLRERPSRAVLLGVGIAAGGALLLMTDDLDDRGSLLGNLLALSGGMASSAYIVAGRGARRKLSTASYTAVVYGLTAGLLLLALLATTTPAWGHSNDAYLYILLMALVPQLIGHNAFNWALGSIPAAIVAVAILGEPVVASAIAAVWLDEIPTLIEVFGGVIILIGVTVALRPGREGAPAAA